MSNYKEEEPLTIPLGNNLIAWISQKDEDIAGFPWRAKKSGPKDKPYYYAYCRINHEGVYIEHALHTLVWERMLGTPLPRGFLIDHINGDKLNCCRYNLRLATRKDNEANKLKRRNKTSSKYKGVTKISDGRKKCWRALVTADGRTRNLGTFYDEDSAGRAYNKAALELFGDFAMINDIEDLPPEPNPDDDWTLVCSWSPGQDTEEEE